MRKIMYEDCNNNATFLKGLLIQIQALSDTELSWSASNLDFIPVDYGDFVGGVPDIKMEKLYDFQKRILEEHRITINHHDLLDLVENIRSIYEGEFVTVSNGEQIKIKVFDGDIIEINGQIEDELEL